MSIGRGGIYLDASVLVALFVRDVFSPRAARLLADEQEIFVVSDFAAAELSSAIARRVRTRHLTEDEARGAFEDFDIWFQTKANHFEIIPSDIANAAAVRRLDLSLHTPGALHIAIAQRLGASLATFDRTMTTAASALGVVVEPI